MIINEKYLQDIDDEDDIIPSGNEFNSNKKHLDYDFIVNWYDSMYHWRTRNGVEQWYGTAFIGENGW